MAGRWMMASIQMTFAIMPAAVYWVGGFAIGRSTAITIGTLVAFTTLQTRLFAPIGSLLSISVDVQSSLALFDRIFEYLDLRVDIEEGTRDGRARARRRAPRATSGSATARPTGRCEAIDIEVPAGTKTAIVGETGAGKTTLGYLVARLYDVTRGARHDRRRRRARADVRRRSRPRSASSRRRPTSSTRPCARTCASRSRTRPTRRSRRPRARRRSTR